MTLAANQVLDVDTINRFCTQRRWLMAHAKDWERLCSCVGGRLRKGRAAETLLAAFVQRFAVPVTLNGSVDLVKELYESGLVRRRVFC